jgi:large subunit ribosomal protein L16
MAMMPKRVKWRKLQRGRLRGVATRGNTVAFGEYGLMALEKGFITARQIEAGRVAAQRLLGTEGRLYVRVFPDTPITQKPLETRMGKGKGDIDHYSCRVRPGRVMYEVGGVAEEFARLCLNAVAHKLCVKTKLAVRRV